jgi:hypothetical protein
MPRYHYLSPFRGKSVTQMLVRSYVRSVHSAVKNRHNREGIMASHVVVTNTNSSLISAIRNLVCPLCGASMMGFRCLGYCRNDWCQDWERAICAGSKSEGPHF